MATTEETADAISLETVNKFIKSGFVRITEEEDRCQIAFCRDALQWYVSEGILRALAMVMKATGGSKVNRRRQPTHQHDKRDRYREIARGELEADRTPVVIYDYTTTIRDRSTGLGAYGERLRSNRALRPICRHRAMKIAPGGSPPIGRGAVEGGNFRWDRRPHQAHYRALATAWANVAPRQLDTLSRIQYNAERFVADG